MWAIDHYLMSLGGVGADCKTYGHPSEQSDIEAAAAASRAIHHGAECATSVHVEEDARAEPAATRRGDGAARFSQAFEGGRGVGDAEPHHGVRSWLGGYRDPHHERNCCRYSEHWLDFIIQKFLHLVF